MDKNDLINLILSVLGSLLAWNHYKNRIYKSSDKYSTFWPRFWAPDLDSLIFWPIGILADFILSENIFFLIAFPTYIVNNFIFYGYSIFMHARYGQTIGKMICKVRVIDYKTETAIGLRQAFLRDSIPLFSSILIAGYELKLIIFGKYNFIDLQNQKLLKNCLGHIHQLF